MLSPLSVRSQEKGYFYTEEDSLSQGITFPQLSDYPLKKILQFTTDLKTFTAFLLTSKKQCSWLFIHPRIHLQVNSLPSPVLNLFNELQKNTSSSFKAQSYMLSIVKDNLSSLTVEDRKHFLPRCIQAPINIDGLIRTIECALPDLQKFSLVEPFGLRRILLARKAEDVHSNNDIRYNPESMTHVMNGTFINYVEQNKLLETKIPYLLKTRKNLSVFKLIQDSYRPYDSPCKHTMPFDYLTVTKTYDLPRTIQGLLAGYGYLSRQSNHIKTPHGLNNHDHELSGLFSQYFHSLSSTSSWSQVLTTLHLSNVNTLSLNKEHLPALQKLSLTNVHALQGNLFTCDLASPLRKLTLIHVNHITLPQISIQGLEKLTTFTYVRDMHDDDIAYQELGAFCQLPSVRQVTFKIRADRYKEIKQGKVLLPGQYTSRDLRDFIAGAGGWGENIKFTTLYPLFDTIFNELSEE